jgi:hypothetical protein
MRNMQSFGLTRQPGSHLPAKTSGRSSWYLEAVIYLTWPHFLVLERCFPQDRTDVCQDKIDSASHSGTWVDEI